MQSVIEVRPSAHNKGCFHLRRNANAIRKRLLNERLWGGGESDVLWGGGRIRCTVGGGGENPMCRVRLKSSSESSLFIELTTN